MLFQTLVAAWPLELAAEDREGVDALRERVAQWQVKSLREGKLRSGWFAPDTAYEDGCAGFLARRLADAGFVRELIAFVDTIAPAAALKGLSQCMLRLTCPGVPDLYQGTEFWDFSLTDPDNRRPVDYAARMQALSAHAAPAALLKHWRDGRVKQALIRQL